MKIIPKWHQIVLLGLYLSFELLWFPLGMYETCATYRILFILKFEWWSDSISLLLLRCHVCSLKPSPCPWCKCILQWMNSPPLQTSTAEKKSQIQQTRLHMINSWKRHLLERGNTHTPTPREKDQHTKAEEVIDKSRNPTFSQGLRSFKSPKSLSLI